MCISVVNFLNIAIVTIVVIVKIMITTVLRMRKPSYVIFPNHWQNIY